MKFVMKTFILFLIFPFMASAQDLSGLWRNASELDAKPIEFIKVNETFYFHSQEKFILPGGMLSHTIDQSVKVRKGSSAGTVDFYDSRGCSFKNLSVEFDFEDENTVNVLMTVPRYKYVTTTVSRPYDRPRYCIGPRGYTYICGTEEVISRSSECRLIEELQVPVRLIRVR